MNKDCILGFIQCFDLPTTSVFKKICETRDAKHRELRKNYSNITDDIY